MATKLLNLETERRDSILNAALKEFVLQGYDNASTNVIAKEAAISKALMFHYVSSKQELFFTVYDYFSNLIQKEYFDKMDYQEKDIFVKLRKSYILQIKLVEKYPFILEFEKLSKETNHKEVNEELEIRKQNRNSNCYPKLFDNIDVNKFRKELDIEKCKQFIFWSNVGFTNQILEKMRSHSNISIESITSELDGYFDELRKIFYV